MKFQDLTDRQFGKLTVISQVVNEHGKSRWLCKCDCGILCTCTTTNLTSGSMIDCGCVKRKELSLKQRDVKRARLKGVWQNMISRCYNNRSSSYKNYGCRGITVCDEWKDNFQSFYDWSMNNGYSDELTIDRIDVNGNYEPSNCRWVNRKIQANNTRRNRFYTYNGKTQTLKQWADEYGIKYSTLVSRMRTYDNIEFVLSTRWCD